MAGKGELEGLWVAGSGPTGRLGLRWHLECFSEFRELCDPAVIPKRAWHGAHGNSSFGRLAVLSRVLLIMETK